MGVEQRETQQISTSHICQYFYFFYNKYVKPHGLFWLYILAPTSHFVLVAYVSYLLDIKHCSTSPSPGPASYLHQEPRPQVEGMYLCPAWALHSDSPQKEPFLSYFYFYQYLGIAVCQDRILCLNTTDAQTQCHCVSCHAAEKGRRCWYPRDP